MKNYVISANIDKPMNWLNIASIVVIFASGIPLMWFADLDVVGFSLMRLAYE